ncbi:MAG TPA: polymer-forming cytoskeletal protein [Alphaproteobacteria bacterium]|jgi:cytoskeletal protein CcmA (bactofilin family)|nr:polymer-forming cytoskeletal protein [Alphaproteobacteria bacterium]
MTVEKKMIRSDIPGHTSMLTGTMPYGTAHAAPQQTEEHRRLMLGREIKLSGEITNCEHLIIEGTLSAATLETQRLDLLETGAFTGSATVKDAIIAGRFDGKLVVTGRLSIKSTAVVKGDISYGALEIEAGSRIEASIAARPVDAVVKDQKDAPVAAVEKQLLTTANDAGADADKKADDDKSGDKDGSVETTQERPGTFRRAVGF